MMPGKKEGPHYAGHRDRLKRKFRASGLSGWLDHEVLEFALSYAIPRKDTKPLAKELLNRFKTFGGALDASVEELEAVPGISEHTALCIKLFKDVSGRYLNGTLKEKDLLSSPYAAVGFLRAVLQGARDEKFMALFLDARNALIASEELQTGTVSRAAVYPRTVVERALHHHAVGVIIAHNHPAGSLEPSDDDRETTAAVQKALDTVEVTLLDHLLIGGNGYFSWKENALL